jgi:hypothetical protein
MISVEVRIEYPCIFIGINMELSLISLGQAVLLLMPHPWLTDATVSLDGAGGQGR